MESVFAPGAVVFYRHPKDALLPWVGKRGPGPVVTAYSGEGRSGVRKDFLAIQPEAFAFKTILKPTT
jgi:hypothetical protein